MLSVKLNTGKKTAGLGIMTLNHKKIARFQTNV